MSALSDALSASNNFPDARRTRAAHPKGFEPGIKWAPDGLPTVAAISSDHEVAAEDHRKTIEEATGHHIPPEVDVRLAGLTLGQNSTGDTDRWWYKYSFPLRSDVVLTDDYDHIGALKQLRRDRKSRKPIYVGESTFGLSWNDWQAGKSAGGGTPALVERVHRQIAGAIDRTTELRKIGRDLGRLVIVGGGDMIEGCDIYTNQSFELDLPSRRKQINRVTTLILHGLDELAPLFKEVTVLVVGGNHGEHRLNGKKINRDDNDDCLVFENAARVAERDPRLAHVNFVIAQDEPSKTLDINGWIYCTTHGQVFGKGAGSAEAKAHAWQRGQAGGHLPAGDADVLLSHHWHHEARRNWGACLWQQTPANDGGSPQHTDFTGDHADSGMFSWAVTPKATGGCRMQDELILR